MTRQASDTRMALSRCALFKHAAADILASVENHAKALQVRRGERIFNVGERCPGVYIVGSGRVALSVVSRPDTSKVIDLVGSGNHFGLAAAILDGAQNVAAHALADSMLVMVPRATLLEAANGHAPFGLQLAIALSRGVAALTDDMEAHALHSGRQRVANYLLHVAAANAARGRPFPLPAKKSIIASRLGLTPEYFSRMLHELITSGLIAVEGRQITILDSDKLRDAGASPAGA